MAKKTTSQLKTQFVDGATISGSNFTDVFDSTFNLANTTGTQVASSSLHISGGALTLTTHGAAVDTQLLVGGPGQQIVEVSSSDDSARIYMRVPSTKNAFIDIDEGGDNRWMVG